MGCQLLLDLALESSLGLEVLLLLEEWHLLLLPLDRVDLFNLLLSFDSAHSANLFDQLLSLEAALGGNGFLLLLRSFEGFVVLNLLDLLAGDWLEMLLLLDTLNWSLVLLDLLNLLALHPLNLLNLLVLLYLAFDALFEVLLLLSLDATLNTNTLRDDLLLSLDSSFDWSIEELLLLALDAPFDTT